MKLSLFLVAACVAAPFAQTDFSSWAHYRDIVINPSTAGGISTQELNYPLLVRLTTAGGAGAGSFNFSQAMANGEDVRFQAIAAVGDHPTVRKDLPYEIERWTNGAAEIWVKLDTLRNAGNTRVRMYWGKTGSTAASSGSTVFGSAVNAFRGVLHFNNSLNNSTDIAITPIDNGTTNASASVIGQGRVFDGSSNSVDLGPTTLLNSSLSHSIGAWVNSSSLNYGSASNSWRNIISHGNGSAADHEVLRSQYAADGTSFWSFGYWDGSINYMSQAEVVNSVEENTWVYIAGAFDGASFTLYRNGIAQTVTAMGGIPLVSSTQNWFLSQHGATAGRNFSGTMDEVRLASTVRSASWFKWDYETQKAGQTAVIYGAVDVPTGISSYAANTASFSFRIGGSSLVMRMPAIQGAASVRLSVEDVSGRRIWDRTLRLEEIAAAPVWDARGATGAPVSAGIYVVRATFLDANLKTLGSSSKNIAL